MEAKEPLNQQRMDYFEPPPYEPVAPPKATAPPYQPESIPLAPMPTQQPIIMIMPNYGQNPVQTTCPNCRNTVISSTTREDSIMQHIFCFVMCLVGLYCCSCIPYCMNSLQNVRHNCPQCNAYLGTYKP